MAASFNSELLHNYPQPLAGAYARFLDQRGPTEQQNLLIALFEALLKYLAAAGSAHYLNAAPPDAALDAALATLRRPSLGHWAALLRETLAWAERQGAPLVFPELPDLYSRPSPRLAAGAVLWRRLTGGGATRASLRQIFDALVEYRNRLAHGAAGGDDAAAIVPLLQAALEEILLALPSLAGRRLVYVEEITLLRGGVRQLALLTLMSARPFLRPEPRQLAASAALPEPEQLYIMMESDLLPLAPLLAFVAACQVCRDAGVGVVNEAGQRGAAEYLLYGCGHTSRVEGDEMAALLARVGSAPQTAAVQPAPEAAVVLPPNNLPPQSTAFIGREKDVVALVGMLAGSTRLVTLTGPGGCGKTRLALEAARKLLDRFADGVLFVPLAAVSDPDLVLPAIAQTLGVGERGGRSLIDEVKAQLSDCSMLLVLDNFEHVIGAAGLVAELLAATPGLKVLVTSRAVLRLYGEKEVPVEPLVLPDPRNLPPLEQLGDFDAVRLFVERARLVRPDFALSADNAAAVAEICVRLDGLPLAIELAAARVKLLPPPALLARLQNSLKLLVGGARDLPLRQQTLRGAIEWSFNLLDEVERALFMRLALFRGGGDLEAAAAVCADDARIDVLEGAASLIDKSLLHSGELNGEPRFTMLETIREFGLERLEESGVAETARRAHAEFYAALCEETGVGFYFNLNSAQAQRLSADYENVRAAVNWSLQRDGASARRICRSLPPFWVTQGLLGAGAVVEGIEWANQAMKLPGATESPEYHGLLVMIIAMLGFSGNIAEARRILERNRKLLRRAGQGVMLGRTLGFLAEAVGRAGDAQEALVLAQEGAALNRAAGDDSATAELLVRVGLSQTIFGDYDAARATLTEGLELARRSGDFASLARSSSALGDIARIQGRDDEARRYYQEVLDLGERQGTLSTIPSMLHNLAHIVVDEGDPDKAQEMFAESLGYDLKMNDWGGIAEAFTGFAAVALAQGRASRATTLLGASMALWEHRGLRMWAAEQFIYDRLLAASHAALDDAAWNAAWGRGKALGVEAAVAYAQGEAD